MTLSRKEYIMVTKRKNINEALLLIADSKSENERIKAKITLSGIFGNLIDNWDENSIKDAYLNPDNLNLKKELDEVLQEKIEYSFVRHLKEIVPSTIIAIPISIESISDVEIMVPVIQKIKLDVLSGIIKESLIPMDSSSENGSVTDLNDLVVTVFERCMTADDINRMGSCWLHELHHMSGSKEHGLALLDSAFELLPHYELIKSGDPKMLFLLFSVQGYTLENKWIDHKKFDDESWFNQWTEKLQSIIYTSIDKSIIFKTHKPDYVIQAIRNENTLSESISIKSILSWACLTLRAVPAEMHFRFALYENESSGRKVFLSINHFNKMLYGKVFEKPSEKIIDTIINIGNENKMGTLGLEIKGDVVPSNDLIYGSRESTEPLVGSVH